MSFPLDFHPAVRDENSDGYNWYEQRQPGLGGEFLDEVERVLVEITANPGITALRSMASARGCCPDSPMPFTIGCRRIAFEFFRSFTRLEIRRGGNFGPS